MEDFPDNCTPVQKGVIECLLCASVKVASPLDGEKIFSEYSNDRNTLKSKMVQFKRGQFR